jgi:uncharacterized protein (DUF2461 family)
VRQDAQGRIGRDIRAPGFYVHLAPGECFLAVGMWRSEPVALDRVRHAILEWPDRWRRVRNDRKFRERLSLDGNGRDKSGCRESRALTSEDGAASRGHLAEAVVRHAKRLCRRVPQTMLTIIETCRQQGRNTFAFVADALRAHFAGRSPASLIARV